MLGFSYFRGIIHVYLGLHFLGGRKMAGINGGIFNKDRDELEEKLIHLELLLDLPYRNGKVPQELLDEIEEVKGFLKGNEYHD